MNDTQKQQIEKLIAEGLSYRKISESLGLSINEKIKQKEVFRGKISQS